MKKSIRSLMVMTMVLIMVLTSMSAAFAGTGESTARFTSLADDLKTLGLFQGTQNGYDLERPATRAEASAMLVRLLGKEEEAKAGTYTHPFTDVLDWAQPYVGYLYENGLTTGVSAEKFGSSTQCSAQMYATFLLRALGYTEKGEDFTYAGAIDFAVEKGIADPALVKGAFLRDQVAATSYNALAVQVKGTETCLLQKLLSEGAVDADVAKPLLTKINTAADFLKISEKHSGLEGASMDASATMKMTVEEAGQTTITDMNMDTITKVANNELQMATTMTMNGDEGKINVKTYQKDGYLYTDDGEQKIKMYIGEFMDFENAGMQQYLNMGTPLYQYDSITRTTAGSNTVYAIKISPSVVNAMTTDLMDSFMSELGDMGSIEIKAYTMEITVDKDGNIKNLKYDMEMMVEDVKIAMAMTMQVKAIGDAVKITFPDFSDYQELTDEEDIGTDTAE